MGLARPRRSRGGAAGGGCLAIVGCEGRDEEVERPAPRSPASCWRRRRRRRYRARVTAGRRPLPRALPARRAARRWASGGDARDGHVLVLAAGALCSGRRGPARLADRAGTPPVILCHVSHVYPSGASLYFTVACAQPATRWPSGGRPRPRPATRSWPPAARSPITTASGATTAHWYRREVGPLGVDGPARGQAHSRPGGDPQPGRAARGRGRCRPVRGGSGMSGDDESTPTSSQLATLAVRFGANVQPGQIVAVSSEPGQGGAGARDRRVRVRRRGPVRGSHRVRRAPQAGSRAARRSRHPGIRAAVAGRARSGPRRASLPPASRCPGRSRRSWLDDVDPELIGLDMLPAGARGDDGDQRRAPPTGRSSPAPPRLGDARVPAARAAGRAGSAVGGGRARHAGWTSRTRWPPGRPGWASSSA